MCLIVHREPNKKNTLHFPDRYLDYNKRMNPDGFGIAWREKGEVNHRKFAPGEKHFTEFKALLQDLDKDKVEYVAHFRRATQGPPCLELSHPFAYDDPVAGQILVFHNGIIDIKADKVESDTEVFVKHILTQLPPLWWTNSAYRWLVGESVGYSKLLLMTPTETVRLNEERWTKEGGIWYSTSPGPIEPKVWSGKGMLDDDEESYYVQWLKKNANTGTTNDDRTLLPMIPKDGWYDQLSGHHSRPVSPFYGDGWDDDGLAICEDCFVEGNYYVVMGTLYVDIRHEIIIGE